MSGPTPNIFNRPAPNTPYFTPTQSPPAGTALNPQPGGKPIPKLFQPIKIRGVEFHNRIFVAPLAQYSADNGAVTAWHLAHLGGILTRGPGLTFVEATSVLPESRTSPQDTGLWSDAQIEPLRKIVEFAHSQGQKIGIQLVHGGRKSSTNALWLDNGAAITTVGGWPDNVWGASGTKFADGYPQSKELSKEQIKDVVRAFVDAAKRALRAGFDVIEIHNAHGFLLHEFVSPISNKRTDEYGGSFENRVRLTLEVVDAIRGVIPDEMPLFLRISATDWLEEVTDEPSWRLEDTVRLAGLLPDHGVDFIDVSSSGNDRRQIIKNAGAPAYQAPLALAVKKAVGDRLVVGAVGSITDGHIAQEVLNKGHADVVSVGRMFQKNPGLVWSFAEDLGVSIKLPNQIEWAFKGRAVKKVEAVGGHNVE